MLWAYILCSYLFCLLFARAVVQRKLREGQWFLAANPDFFILMVLAVLIAPLWFPGALVWVFITRKGVRNA